VGNEANPHPHAYEADVLRVVSQAWATNPVARIVIARMAARAGGHQVRIVPYRGPLNAVTDAAGMGAFSAIAGGTGTGADVTVAFTPGLYRHRGGAGNSPASTLVHELVHSLRETRGHDTGIRIPMGANYDNREEFYAVTIQSMFDAATGSVLLRSNHGEVRSQPRRDHHNRFAQDPFDWVGENQFVFNRGQERPLEPGTQAILNQVFGPVPAGRTQADQLFSQYGIQLAQLVHEEPDLCQLLAQVNCRGYNSIAIALAANVAGPLPPPPPMPQP
jgi:hypothetical protein